LCVKTYQVLLLVTCYLYIIYIVTLSIVTFANVTPVLQVTIYDQVVNPNRPVYQALKTYGSGSGKKWIIRCADVVPVLGLGLALGLGLGLGTGLELVIGVKGGLN